MSEVPKLIRGGSAVDDRGRVVFCNDADLRAVRRFYMVTNHVAGLVRAWHAHRHEAKFVTVLSGAAIVGAVAIDDWQSPSKEAPVHRFVLAESDPAMVYIPPGHANGFKTLASDTRVLFLTTATLAESQGDDHRFDAYHWDPWSVEER